MRARALRVLIKHLNSVRDYVASPEKVRRLVEEGELTATGRRKQDPDLQNIPVPRPNGLGSGEWLGD